MNTVQDKSDNLSDFLEELKRVELTHFGFESVELSHARKALAGAISGFKSSRMNLGRVLRTYKLYFRKDRGWTAPASIIATALGREARTVERIIADYERASDLSPILLDAMEEKGIDPAALKNAGTVENLLKMPEPTNREEAAMSVEIAHQKQVLLKTERRKMSVKKPANISVDDFAVSIVRQFDRRYRSMETAKREGELRFVLELLVNTLGSDLRELRHFSSPGLVPKPAARKAA